MDPVVHFQMPAEDRNRVSDFYSKAFGWHMNQLGPDMGNYVVAVTAESDEKAMSKTPNTINGGFFMRTKPDQSTNIVIHVNDIQEAMKKVVAAGGTILGGMQTPGVPDDMPGVGLFISFRDTEGNFVGLLQPTQ